MEYLEKLKKEQDYYWLTFEEKRVSEILIEYQYLASETRNNHRISDFQKIIAENCEKLDLIRKYKNEVAEILWKPYFKVLH